MCETGLNGAASANRTGGGRDVAADGDVTTQRESAHGIVAVEHNDEVCDVRANLKTPANTAGCNTAGRRPRSVGQTSNDQARACLAAKDKACFEYLEDSETWPEQC